MKIIAVIVTHNRCLLLSRCLDHILSQTRAVDGILVINNASEDDTVDLLIRRSVPFITQENVGSAGGWHRGIQYAMDNQYDAIWLMDDDGFPDARALAALEATLIPGVACASSVVLCEDRPQEFVFPFPVLDDSNLPVLFARHRKIKTLETLQTKAVDHTYPFAHLFNGALVSMNAIRQIGNVNQAFFIFGDEVDYFFRLRQVGSVLSVLDAKHFHPDVSRRPYTSAKVYYYIKNTFILNARYFNAVWLRHGLTLAAILWRTTQRNGIGMTGSLLLGSRSRVFYSAIIRGLRAQLGKDFND